MITLQNITKYYYTETSVTQALRKINLEFHAGEFVAITGESGSENLTQCGREFQLVVHQFEHEVSGMYPQVAHGAGLAAIWCSWARYVYKANISRWLQYSSRVWNVDIDFEHPEKTIETSICLQEEYYESIGMPTNLRSLGVKKEDIETLALRCSRNKTRTLLGDMPLGYNEILDIYTMAY